MLNKEKYAKEIMDIACTGHNIAINSRTKKLCSCGSIMCSNCERNRDGATCSKAFETWCNSKYIPSGVRLHIDIEYDANNSDMSEIKELFTEAGYNLLGFDFEKLSESETAELLNGEKED